MAGLNIFLIQIITDAIKANKEASNQEQEEINKEIPTSAAEVTPTKTAAADQLPAALQSQVHSAANIAVHVTGNLYYLFAASNY